MKTPLLISLVGQTATGKTSLALKIADQLLTTYQRVILLSADSKQVFQGLETLTGADIPQGFGQIDSQPYCYWSNADKTIELHGVSIIKGNASWSAAHFQELFQQLYQQLTNQEVIVVVGGTGLYHQQIFDPAETTGIEPNHQLRKQLSLLSLNQLQEKLKEVNATRWEAMNYSDRNNPRRLIRSIEVAQSKRVRKPSLAVKPSLQIGLELPSEKIQQKISQRVGRRIGRGVTTEIKRFAEKYPEDELQAKASLGYLEIINHLTKEINLETLISSWTLAELQYAKSQQTWWRKKEDISWFSAEQTDNVIDAVSKIA